MTVMQQRLFANEYPKRPGRHDVEVERRTALALVDEVAKWAESEDSKDQILNDLIRAIDSNPDDDGYSLARSLDDRGYSSDSDLVDILDGVGHEQYMAHKAVVSEWVSAHGLELDLPVGASVLVTLRGKEHTGEITARLVGTAQYAVFVASLGHVREGIGTNGIILNFEDLIAAGKDGRP